MSTERSPEQTSSEMSPLYHENISAANGPIDLMLGSDRLQIIDPLRDSNFECLDDRSGEIVKYLVIDRRILDTKQRQGLKGLRDGEEIILGRSHTYRGRFRFSHSVSRDHVRIRRQGDIMEIEDLDSTNGTFIALPGRVPQPMTEADTPEPEHTVVRTVRPERTTGLSFPMAGESIPASYRRIPEDNEDNFFIDERGKSLGVFDGTGSKAGSSEASAIAATCVERSLERVPTNVPKSIAELTIREALDDAHDEITQRGAPNIATTAIVAKIFETESGAPYAVVGSAGDSRAYLIRNGAIQHVTLDHVYWGGVSTSQQRDIQETLAQATDLSLLSPEERAMFDRRHIISSCLGRISTRPTISVATLQLQPDDRLLLTSDGIHDNLTSNEIEDIAANEPTVNLAVHSIIAAAAQRSKDRSHPRHKSDDMTAAMLSVKA